MFLENGVVLKIIVMFEIGCIIVKVYGLDIIDMLIGFKFIGEKIR